MVPGLNVEARQRLAHPAACLFLALIGVGPGGAGDMLTTAPSVNQSMMASSSWAFHEASKASTNAVKFSSIDISSPLIRRPSTPTGDPSPRMLPPGQDQARFFREPRLASTSVNRGKRKGQGYYYAAALTTLAA